MAKRARGAPQERPSFQASCSKQACLPRSLLRARPRGQEKPHGPSSYQVCATGGPGGRAAPGRAAEGVCREPEEAPRPRRLAAASHRHARQGLPGLAARMAPEGDVWPTSTGEPG